MNTDPSRPIGFRQTVVRGATDRIGWRFWVGPLIVARVPGTRFEWWSARRSGWDSPPAHSLTIFGISIGWALR